METPISTALPGDKTENSTIASPPETAAKVVMVFRLWTSAAKEGEASRGEQTADLQAGLLAFIEDVAAQKNAVLQNASTQPHISGFGQPCDALVIARRVEAGLRGFRAKSGASRVAVSIAIDSSGDATAAVASPEAGREAEDGSAPSNSPTESAPGPSHDLLALLKLSKPAQVLLTHDLCQRSVAVKSLPLKSFPARFGVYEYLWTSPEKLEVLQSEPQLTLATVPVAPAKTEQAAQPAEETAAVPVKNADEPNPPIEKTMQIDEEEERDWKAMLRSPLAAVYAGLAVAVIGIATFVGVRLARDSARHPVVVSAPEATIAPAAATAPGSGAVTTAAQSTTPQPGSTPPGGTATATGNAAPATTPETNPVAPPAHKPTRAVEKHPAQPAPSSAPCNLPGDVSRYVGLAEQARARGDYANAIRRFHEILACDPNNAAAQQGLNRAIQGEQQNRN